MKSLQSVFEIGPVRVDPALDLIYKGGATIKLEPRMMRLLVCLAEYAGDVVSVDQLLASVWKDVVVSPYSVYQAIGALRRILGDSPKNPRYIANVMRRGYRLVTPVTEVQLRPAATFHVPAVSLFSPCLAVATTHTTGSWKRWWPTLAFVVAFAVGDGVERLHEPQPSAPAGAVQTATPTTNPAAYTLYIKARASKSGASAEDFRLAMDYVQQALSIDPGFQQAWAELADLMMADMEWHDSRRTEPNCKTARNAAERAVQLGPERTVGRMALGRVLAYCEWNWTAAEAEFRRALAIDPTDPDVLKGMANFDWTVSHTAEQLALARRLVQQDPLNSDSYSQLAVAQGLTAQYQASIASWKRAIKLNPTQFGLHALLSNAYLAAGEPTRAFEELKLEPDAQFRAMNWAFIFDALGRTEDADAAMAAYVTSYAEKDPETIAVFYACRRQIDLSIQWLERLVAQHGLLVDVANKEACWKALDQDPRYQAVVRRVNSVKWPNVT